ncbi:Serine/threonine-protein kinase tel1, partial [Coemansia guatemalensis]
ATGGRLLAELGDAEEALYGVLRRRAGGQVAAAAAAARVLLGSPQAVEAVTLPARAAGDRWAFRAVAALLPLAAGDIGGALGRTAFAQASGAAAAVLAWSRGMVDSAALEPMHQANVALHEARASTGCKQYTAAVRAACVAARRAGGWQAAMGLVFRLRTVTDGDAVLGAALRLWEAETLWEAGSERLAAEMLRGLLATLGHVAPTDATAVLQSRVVLTAGEWAERLRSERAEVLWDAYFGRAARLLEDVAAPTAWTGRALHALAGFAARQCDELTAARDDEAAAALRRHKARELAACQQAAGGSRDAARLRALQRRLEAQVAGDRREREALRASIDGFLRLALWALTQSLTASDAFDDDVYTLVALVATHERAPEMQRTLSAGLAPNVPSRKFLPLARQLCGRLGGEGVVAAGVAALARRMTIDYPFHVVPLLLALRNASARRGAPDGGVLERQRSSAAARLVTDAAAAGSELRSVVGTIDSLCGAYIELAAAPVPERMRGPRAEGRVVPFGARLRIAQLFRAPPPGLPVLTAAPRTGAPRDYACVPFVMSAAPGYTLAGGVNLPKITRLLGDDGYRHKQLVKGRDDLRQDAVIQQLFALFNRCMRGPVRAARPLRLRTYQVVPLTPRAGLLQWVDDTVPLGTWFRAHEAAYRPHAPSSAQLRATVHAVHRDADADASRRRAVFDRVCEQAPPIFRFFFFEHFASPPCWYARRDAYIRSAAAASIAGWVLGIGDRHLQNILVDHRSAELVHIDLGIAFDLGRLLPVPELVPFRLTRELVDGMGLLGLDATFRHACHAALHAMRDNARV